MASASNSGGGRRLASLFPWLVPQPRPEPESESEVTSVTPMVNILSSNPSSPATTHQKPAKQTPPASQSSGPASSSNTGKKNVTDSSQAKDSTDADRRKDAISVQALLPDIGEVQDDFGTSWVFDGISPDRLHAYTNLEFLRVKQDIERRPVTFQRCFEHSESPQKALEYIYAAPPTLSVSELMYCQQEAEQQMRLRAGMADGGAGEADVTGFTNSRSVLRYERQLEDKYGFAIEWGEASDETNKAGQLNNVVRSFAHIVNYLAEQVYVGDQGEALEAFQQYFSQSKFGQLEIHLGTESDPNYKGYGSVPLPYYDGDGNLINTDVEELKKMYLGSAVLIPTIVHEFGHVVDRSRGFTDHLINTIPPYGMSRIATVSREYGEDYGDKTWGYYSFNLDTTVYSDIIEGFVAKQYFVQELWADLFMTAVLDPAVSGERFTVDSIDDIPDHIEIFDDFTNPKGPIFRCNTNAPCIERPVEWEDTDKAEAAQWYLPIVFRELLSE